MLHTKSKPTTLKSTHNKPKQHRNRQPRVKLTRRARGSRLFSTAASQAPSLSESGPNSISPDPFSPLKRLYKAKKFQSNNASTHQLAQEYEPKVVEAEWDQYWQDASLFSPSLLRSNKFVLLLPPPNVTGTLHLGHALTVGIQDTITRYKRMSGHSTLWVPGVDHAGIATQVVVEKQLKKSLNKSRHDLGREEFIKKVWEWKDKYGDTIFSQLKRLGTSLDWSRARFTLDPICEEAVVEAFMRLYDDSIIYRDNRIVSWCCTLRSAISTIEIDNIEVQEPMMLNVPNFPRPVEVGVIHDFKYKIVTKKYAKKVLSGEIEQDLDEIIDPLDDDNYITISTTRIETMLGDVAVAVHPADQRYKRFHSTKPQTTSNTDNTNPSEGDENELLLEHPLIPNYFIPVVFDDVLVDMNFGTGAVKITPAHDPNDYQLALRHNLPLNLSLLDDQGHFSHPFHAEYNGLHRYEVREKVTERLKRRNIYKEKRPNPMAISVCSRSGDLIEPMVKPQWWIRSDEMASAGKISAEEDINITTNVDGVNYQAHSLSQSHQAPLQKKKLSFTPANAFNDWSRWLDNNQDWCISRQLWWGHRIPAYYMSFQDDQIDSDGGQVEDPGRWVIARSLKHAEEKAEGIIAKRFPGKKLKSLRQDEDVLDTWFSSGLFPFSAMGWPHNGVDEIKQKVDAMDETTRIETEKQVQRLSKNKDFLRFFPGSLLETGNDILFFWVARMVMLSQTLTGSLPFEHVYLHTLIRDKSGRKMSKSLGNVIDPLDVINGIELEGLFEKLSTSNLAQSEIAKAKAQQELDFPQGIPACGADSLRYGLLSYTKQSGDINLDLNTIVTAKHFKNKIWQAMRFTMGNIAESEAIFTPPINGFPDVQKALKEQAVLLSQSQPNVSTKSLDGTFEQQWLLHRLTRTVDQVNEHFEKYQFGEATALLQKFFIEDLCSRFLEISKTVVRKSFYRNGVEEPNVHYHPLTANATLNVLYYSIETFLKLLHPISPYLTEELWFSLPSHLKRIQEQSSEVENDIIGPILTMIEEIQQDMAQNGKVDPTIAQQNSKQQKMTPQELDAEQNVYNAHFNQSLHAGLTALRVKNGEGYSKIMDKYLDVSAFDQKTYENRVAHINKLNNNKLKYDLNPTALLLSPKELKSELKSLQKRTNAGSISTEEFPSLVRNEALANYHNDSEISGKMEKLIDVIDKVRVVKARLQIPNHIKPRIVLEYISPDAVNGDEDNGDDVKAEKEILMNLSDYQHIISILSFVSKPTVLHSTTSSSSLTAKSIGDGANDGYSIKQYISDRVLCHIIIDNPSSLSPNTQDDGESTEQSQGVDFSAELVKSERRVDSLGLLMNQLEQNIARTKDNAKVPEKVKIKNQQDYESGMKELTVLGQNINSLKQIVPRETYAPAKIADLKDQISILNKGREKIVAVMNDNIAKGKANNNGKQQELVNGIDSDIAKLEQQMTVL